MTTTGWTCPACQRRFRRRSQAHSCASRSVDSFFADAPALRAIFDALVTKLGKLGPIHVDASPSWINFTARSHFAGARVVASSLRVGFALRGKLSSPRIVAFEPIGGGRFAHRVDVRTRRELDAELLGWLADAHALSVGG